MAAVNHPLDQTRSNVTFTLVSRDPLQFLSNISIAAAALSFAFALRFVITYRRVQRSRRQAAGAVDQGSPLPQYYNQGNWKKSRGVSNSDLTNMSANQGPVSKQIEVEVGLKPLYDEEGTMRTVDAASGLHMEGSNVVKAEVAMKRHLRARPPPPPPLTPPTLSPTVIAFEERRLSTAMSTTGDLDSSFFSQPNPDYMSSSSVTSSTLPQPIKSPITPNRRLYTKKLPLGPPQPVSWLEEDGSVTSFSPSSYPSSSPTLPLAPHHSFHTHSIDVEGEILSVLDDSGAGWKRHTRVYGGGVCLACLASPDREGGFYGDRVRPEEKR